MTYSNSWQSFEVHCSKEDLHTILVIYAHPFPNCRGYTAEYIARRYPPGWEYNKLKDVFVSAGVTIQNPKSDNPNSRVPHPDLKMLHFSSDGKFVAEWQDGLITSSFDDFNPKRNPKNTK